MQKMSFIVVFFIVYCSTAWSKIAIRFPDQALEKAVRHSLNIPTGDITETTLLSMDFLDADEVGISNLEGIQYLTNLRTLYLDGNSIQDISLLENLIQLKHLYLKGNPIQDYSPLTYIYPFLKGKDFQMDLSQDFILEQVSTRIIREIISPWYNDFEKTLAIRDYILQNADYDWQNFRDNTIPLESYTAYGILCLGVGVCSGYAQAVSLLLNKVGVENKIISGSVKGAIENPDHAWNLVKIQGEWYHMDVTWDDTIKPSGENDSARYHYFLIDDYTMSLIGSRRWNKALYPPATSQRYVYMHDISSTYFVPRSNYFNYGNWTELYKLEQSEYDNRYTNAGPVPWDMVWDFTFDQDMIEDKVDGATLVCSVGWGVYDYYGKDRIFAYFEWDPRTRILTCRPPLEGYQPGTYWLFISRYGFKNPAKVKPIRMLFEVK